MGLLSKVRERKTITYVFTCLCNLKTKINGQLQQNISVCLSLSYFTEQPHLLSQTTNFDDFLLLSNIIMCACGCVSVYVCIHTHTYMYIHHVLFFVNFCWSIFDLHCCVSFFCMPKWIRYTFRYIHSFFYSFPI